MANISSKKGISVIASTIACPDRSTFSGTGPINVNFDAGNGVVIRTINIHLQADPSQDEDLCVRHIVPGESPKFDVVRVKVNMNGTADVVLTDPVYLSPNDQLIVEYPNSDSVAWGVNIVHGSLTGVSN